MGYDFTHDLTFPGGGFGGPGGGFGDPGGGFLNNNSSSGLPLLLLLLKPPLGPPKPLPGPPGPPRGSFYGLSILGFKHFSDYRRRRKRLPFRRIFAPTIRYRSIRFGPTLVGINPYLLPDP